MTKYKSNHNNTLFMYKRLLYIFNDARSDSLKFEIMFEKVFFGKRLVPSMMQ